MTHLDLCSGIGGFALAAREMGWETVAFCEIDPYCKKNLAKNFKDVPIYADLFDFPADEFRGIDIVTAGFPCQPYSLAGQRRGADDDRAIWPKIVEIIGHVKPKWVVCENVAGIRSMVEPASNDEMESLQEATLSRITRDLESIGYDVPRTKSGAPIFLGVPACAVEAIHERDRTWIIANRSTKFERRSVLLSTGREQSANSTRTDTNTNNECVQGSDRNGKGCNQPTGETTVNTHSPGRQNRGHGKEKEAKQVQDNQPANTVGRYFGQVEWRPNNIADVLRVAYGIRRGMDGPRK